MKFPGFTRPLTGVLVPLCAVRTERSTGCGEFADLPILADWCSKVGVDLIQLLPVNDTGWQSSPYSALSAFALHPIYLCIDDLPDLDLLPPAAGAGVRDRLVALRAEYSGDERLRYGAYLDAKREILRAVWDGVCATTSDAGRAVCAQVERFAAEREWVVEYALFKKLKVRYSGASWREWPEHRNADGDSIRALWHSMLADDERLSTLYYVWLQLRLHEQFLAASAAVAAKGVLLKGDLPILVDQDSVDFWAHRRYFSESLRAGAPPDGENPLGQNWGFPTYDWPALERDDYRWWKRRLTHAHLYYSAYRIDHVLGFFRVWGVPRRNSSGALGHFVPCAVADAQRLERSGFTPERVRWLAEPHLPGHLIVDEFGDEAERVIELALSRIGDQDLYLFAPGIRGERDIAALALSADAQSALTHHYRDRALLAVDSDGYVPTWTFRDCSRYRRLSDDERGRFEALASELESESAREWEAQARELLGFMRVTTPMLPCAEDLGAIPHCVPAVLADLGILGLRIPRWARRWAEPGQPYIAPADYPPASVCAPSVHDTSTLREWWLHEPGRQTFWTALGLPGCAPSDYSPDTARTVVGGLLAARSAICVLQIQDILALVEGLVMDDASAERVNVPGTLAEFNWGYRVNHTVEELIANGELTSVVSGLTAARAAQPPPLQDSTNA